jgi:CheY-like chemotaxis protein
MTIRNSGDALLVLIDEILDFSKIEAGKLELESREFSLRAEVEDTLKLYRPVAEAKGLRLDIEYLSSPPARVKGDSIRLRQILSNLISNAIKFTQQGDIRVQVGTVIAEDGQVQLSCAVRDSGIGIPPDRLDRLFKAFSQVDISTTRRFGGTGLGLAICARLCEAMGGGIDVESVPGNGSTFRFTVRLGLGETTGEAIAPAERAPMVDLADLKALVVEDNPVNQTIAVSLLARLGIQADLCENGQEAVERVAATAYDVLLMDMQMPVMDGIEATRAIRLMDLPAQPWIIALTANAFETDRERCLQAGMNDFLSKPFRIDVLRERLLQSRKPAGGTHDHAESGQSTHQ